VADRKISDLTALTTPATGDLIPIVDISEAAAADKNKSITVGELLRGAPDGTAAAPGIAFESDGGNGMFLGGTDILAFSTGGTQAVTIDASQRVGLGTSSPQQLLHISSTGEPTLRIQDADLTNRYVDISQAGGGTFFRSRADASNGSFIFNGFGGGTDDEFMRIDSSGNVGIGTTSPTRPLTVSSSVGATNILGVFDNSATTAVNCLIAFSDPTSTQGQFSTRLGSIGDALAFYTNGSNERVRIDGSGNFGVGTSSPDNSAGYSTISVGNGSTTNGQLDLRGPSSTHSYLWSDTNGLNQYVGTGKNILFSTAGTERMRVTSDGSLALGTITTTNGSIDTDSRIFYYSNNASTSGTLYIDSRKADGFIVINQTYGDTGNRSAVYIARNEVVKGSISVDSSQVYYNTTSDYRLKENIVDAIGGIDLVKQLQPREFNFISDPEKTVTGFIAHEVETVIPNAVFGTKDEVKVWDEFEELPDGVSPGDNKLDENGDTIPVHQCIDQSKLVPVLTAALKEAIAKIETLEAKVAALEAQ
jgi:hypothetical protein